MKSPNIKISVIIPFLNEEENLKKLVPFLQSIIIPDLTEIIFVDGGSTDQSANLLIQENIHPILSEKQGRAAQMNLGASHSKGSILYFLHADTLPHSSFQEILVEADASSIPAGCFRYSFDSENVLLKMNSWFTRFNGIFAGGGDQSLYIQKEVFGKLNGFNEEYCIMEDFDLVRRLRDEYKLHLFQSKITVSDRKYEKNSWLKVQFANLLAYSFFLVKRHPKKIKSIYRTILEI